ncbi:E2/UBC family protein [Pseudofrankia sp. BMG5.37]|uniref:E2/UBC family protein n=1 Tax=Pseudofrankia sp. BMG5.37 TaxID=3050035 RepID=UPI002894AC61|nr:E2/UBC family protein [Pseudofrankia sp. BMG5.37]MDT3440471.1 E2/UBC family protein [Pseudofrankia sp. BMG5.37]
MNAQQRRVLGEAAQLLCAYPELRVAADGSWLLIPEFRLPGGWAPARTTVLIAVPLTYPECAPDGFYLGDRLRRRDGAFLVSPGHYFREYHNPYADLGYLWYCLEDPERRWSPGVDSLVTYVEAIRTYLGETD